MQDLTPFDLSQPIEDQYMDAEKELKGLLERKVRFEKIATTRRLIRVVTLVTIPAMLFTMFYTSRGFDVFETVFRFSSRALVSLVVLLISIMSVIIFYYSRLWEKTAEREVEEARFNRQLSILEDKLKRLEILRKADLRTLVKERKPD